MPKNSAVDLWWPPLFEGAYDATFWAWCQCLCGQSAGLRVRLGYRLVL